MSMTSQRECRTAQRLRPAAPVPHTRALTPIQVVREFGRNTVAAFGANAYRLRHVHAHSWIQDFFLVNDPESIKHILLDNVTNYVKSRQIRRTVGPALGNGLFNAEGPSWRFQRRTAAPMFQARHIAQFAPAMAAAAQEALARWETMPDGAEIDAAEAMMRLTYDIILRTMFSSDVTMQYDAMAKAFATYLETIGHIDVLTTLGLPMWVPTPERIRGRATVRFLRGELEGVIARRRERIARDLEAAPDDLLTLLLTTRDPEGGALFGEREVFDNVLTFMFAGHETTANALAWTLYLLSQFPDADGRVAAEAQAQHEDSFSAGNLGGLVYARMVLEEAMRLYPPAPIISRDSVAADTVSGIAIRPGTAVMISPWVLHRHQTLWEDPEYFDPERFAPGRREKIHRFAYLPFGAGPRICIGMGFAIQEALIVLASMMRRFRLELVPGFAVEPHARLTLRPRNGLRMRVWRR